MDRIKIKEQVVKFRKQGKTYLEIQRKLKLVIPKGTLSYWCRDVILPNWYTAKIKKLNHESFLRAQAMAWASMRRKRELFLDEVRREAVKIFEKFNPESLKIALAMLYLGEGAKWKSHSGLMLGSSDLQIILLYILSLEKCYKIKPIQLKCRISYRADQNIHNLEKYWSDATGIPLENFYKTKPDPRTKGKKTEKKDYMGVCVIYCAGSRIQLELGEIAKLLLEKLRAHSLEEKR